LILRVAVIDLPIFGNFRYGLLCSTFGSVCWIQLLDLRCKSEVNPGLVYRNYKKKIVKINLKSNLLLIQLIIVHILNRNNSPIRKIEKITFYQINHHPNQTEYYSEFWPENFFNLFEMQCKYRSTLFPLDTILFKRIFFIHFKTIQS
jgi:hypothetical protein